LSCRFPPKTSGTKVFDGERQEHAVPARGVGVDADDGPRVGVLDGVGDEPVLAEHDDGVVRPEDEVGEKLPAQGLEPAERAEGGLGPGHRAPVDGVLALVVGEVCPEVLDVELSLRDRVEARDQFFEPRRPRDEDELVLGQTIHNEGAVSS
jgi:hypothetical protein